MANDNTGYIKLNNFSSTSISEIRKAVFSLKNKGMKNLILDLQNNGGGYLEKLSPRKEGNSLKKSTVEIIKDCWKMAK